MDYKIIIITIILCLLLFLIYYEVQALGDCVDNLQQEYQASNNKLIEKINSNMATCINKIKHISEDNLQQLKRIHLLNQQAIKNINSFTEYDDSENDPELHLLSETVRKQIVSAEDNKIESNLYMSETSAPRTTELENQANRINKFITADDLNINKTVKQDADTESILTGSLGDLYSSSENNNRSNINETNVEDDEIDHITMNPFIDPIFMNAINSITMHGEDAMIHTLNSVGTFPDMIFAHSMMQNANLPEIEINGVKIQPVFSVIDLQNNEESEKKQINNIQIEVINDSEKSDDQKDNIKESNKDESKKIIDEPIINTIETAPGEDPTSNIDDDYKSLYDTMSIRSKTIKTKTKHSIDGLNNLRSKESYSVPELREFAKNLSLSVAVKDGNRWKPLNKNDLYNLIKETLTAKAAINPA